MWYPLYKLSFENLLSRDSKLTILISFRQQEPNHHHHIPLDIPQATPIAHHHHIPRAVKHQELEHGEISLHLVQVGRRIHGGMEIQPDQEIEFILI